MKKQVMLLALVAALWAMAGCSEGETVEGNEVCTPGAPADCPCEFGPAGKKYCNAQGTGFSECQGCQEAPLDVEEPEDIVEAEPEPEDVVPEEPEEKEEPDIQQDTNPPTGDCYLNACMVDDHCKGCTFGRNKCWTDKHKCVECIPGGPASQCPNGLTCSLSGKCTQKTCPVDGLGNPQVVCKADADCEACSPEHQICDTDTSMCVECTDFVTTLCADSEFCKMGKCVPKCPQTCELDGDCTYCEFGVAGGGSKPAKACNNHKCSECSPTWGCSGDNVCLPNGVCYPPCGLPGAVQGTCLVHDDCYYCGDPKAPGSYKCKKAVNEANDPNAHGVCMPPAEGCGDIGGPGAVVLPEPWSQYTQACSNDGNCNSISIDYNVGKLIRDLVKADEVMGIPIGNATVKYGMHQCAEIKISGDKKCGVCVPCEKDVDCDPIPVDPLIVQLFQGNALAQIAGLMLVNMLWGDQPEHNLNMFCQPVGLGYGVCAPCGNPLQPCGKVEPEPGTGSCDHTVCEIGGPLDVSCGACSKAVCTNDAYCCTESWDQICVNEVDQYCATPCGGTTPGCSPDICIDPDLPKQDPSCGDCTWAVCDADPFCCNTKWDQYCVDATATLPDCTVQCGGGGGCAHDECEEGGALAPTCSDCAAAVCAADDFCCTTEWDSLCVDEAKQADDCFCF